MNFARPHHQSIARILGALDGQLLRNNACLFGGGTAIALRYGEFRESVDMDFLVSDVSCYRNLRQLLSGKPGINGIFREGSQPFVQAREIRTDQYGIRTMLEIVDKPVKFAIVLEARIQLADPGPEDQLCSIATLTPLDMATSKLLANSDRWADDGVFNRDLIDLAMMNPSKHLLDQAVAKAQDAYGNSILADLSAALNRVHSRHGWLDRCMQAMAITVPKALLWKRIRALQKVLPPELPGGSQDTLNA